MDLLLIGAFFSLQEAANLVVRPFAGRLADRWGCDRVAVAGLLLLAAAFAALAVADGRLVLLAAALGSGLGLGMILPATLAMLSAELPTGTLGAGMGAMGALRNLAKVTGPVLAGALLVWLPYRGLFALGALMLAVSALVVILRPAARVRLPQGSS